VTCSGRLGCRVVAEHADFFNDHASRSMSKLRQRARNRAKAAFPRIDLHVALRGFEHQKRGVLHAHFVVAFTSVPERASADRFVAELARLAPQFGWGAVDVREPRGESPAGAGRYIAKYLTKEAAESGVLPPSALQVSPRLSGETGVTMRSLRQARIARAIRRAEGKCAAETARDRAAEVEAWSFRPALRRARSSWRLVPP